MDKNRWSGPTHYKKKAFRSNLEARWAIFFDQLKLNWKYEPKRYVFGHGYSYTPTFFIQEMGWIEVKLTKEELYKHLSKFYFFKKKVCSDGSDFFVFCASKESDDIKSSIVEIDDGLKLIEGFEFSYCSLCEKHILEIHNDDYYNSRHCDHKRHESVVCENKSFIYEAFKIANAANFTDPILNNTRIIISQ